MLCYIKFGKNPDFPAKKAGHIRQECARWQMSATEKKIMRGFRKAVIDYGLLDDEQPVLVGLSGGKDSLTLLKMLKLFLRTSKYKYKLAAGHIDLGFGQDISPLQKLCDELEVPLFVEHTQISQVVFDYRAEQNPCSLCANMRRGALNNLAVREGYPKVALGHHLDDAAETVLLNMCFNAKVDCFRPKTWLSNREITVIRPLIYVDERTIATYARQEQLPVIDSCCPANTHTKREDMKQALAAIQQFAPAAKQHIVGALQHLPQGDWRVLPKKRETHEEE